MFEFATGHWLFNPKVVDNISRDIVHLSQMTQRTGEEHSDAHLVQYDIQEKQNDIKGKETPVSSCVFTNHHQAC